MLAGLSKKETFRTPPDFWATAGANVAVSEWHIIPDIATRNLSFIAGKFDISSPYGTGTSTLQDVKSQAPQAICEVTPTNVSPAEMRRRPIGTGPFKFVEFKPNEVVRTAKNPDYWKPGRPYLDGIDGQQHLQRLSHGRRLARQINAPKGDGSCFSTCGALANTASFPYSYMKE